MSNSMEFMQEEGLKFIYLHSINSIPPVPLFTFTLLYTALGLSLLSIVSICKCYFLDIFLST